MTQALKEKAATFLGMNPTLLAQIDGVDFYEHPTRGDTAPIYAIWEGCLINTGFWDLDDFYPEVMPDFKEEWREDWKL